MFDDLALQTARVKTYAQILDNIIVRDNILSEEIIFMSEAILESAEKASKMADDAAKQCAGSYILSVDDSRERFAQTLSDAYKAWNHHTRQKEASEHESPRN